MTLGIEDLQGGDLCLYSGSHPAFRALAWAQRIAGLHDATVGHVGLITRTCPRGTWADEGSAYNLPYPGLVNIAAKYPYACEIRRVEGLDVKKAVAFLHRYLKLSYGYAALPWMGLYRKLGFRSWGLPTWTGWERVCSPLILGAIRAGGVEVLPGLHPSLALPHDFAQVGTSIGEWRP